MPQQRWPLIVADIVPNRIQLLQGLETKLGKAMTLEARPHVLRLREVLPPEDEPLNTAALKIQGKETIYYIYVPLCKETLDKHITTISEIHILHERTMLFKSFLKALAVMRLLGYVHQEIKPSNTGSKNGYAVLLDLDQMVKLGTQPLLPCTPGRSGTVIYLAPER